MLGFSEAKGAGVTQVLTIEDDARTAADIRVELELAGFHVHCVNDGSEGLTRAMDRRYDLITLDRMLPGVDGLTIVTTLRTLNITTPVLMLSALGDVDERVRGLRAGGDDYLTKPFSPEELVARLEVLLRRNTTPARGSETVLSAGQLTVDMVTRRAKHGTDEILLLPTEFRILEFLMRHKGRTITRSMLFESVWGYHFDPGTNLIDVHMGRLRRKLESIGAGSSIQTIRGSGYMFNQDERL
ncbi:response regulator transcription factor [Burkholderia multivorans]|uniref:response regulator transcription factor n=1 Tax=Burkholderia multivorans TaxID=87883 RepID=UPI0021C1CB7D|nr:response regulator transcription factor [Burkholderia multivorans]